MTGIIIAAVVVSCVGICTRTFPWCYGKEVCSRSGSERN